MDPSKTNDSRKALKPAGRKKTEAEIYNERIKEVQYEREDVQKKTFGKWINSMLSKGNFPPIKDVFTDLRDGTVLLNLLEVLTKTQIKREKGRMRVHHLNNVSRALEMLKEQKVRLVNISNNEIVDGNCKISLALCWSIFLHWQVNDIMKELMASTHQSNLEKALLQWCQQNTEPYPGVEIKNFSTCWSDGRAFAALVHRFRPELINYGSIANMNIMNRLETTFTVCEDQLGIERLLDPEDVNTSVPDKKSVMMYVMCLFQALTLNSLEPPPLPNTDTLVASIEQECNNGTQAIADSKEMESYNSIVEEVLGWLIQAGDVVEKFGEISDDLKVVKSLFQEHERFMLTLTEHQADVGEVLQEGSRLLTELKLKPDDVEHVKVQMKILNDKWEELRIASMDRQNKIHEKLMALQLSELSNLKEFLTKTEDEMSSIIDMKFDLDAIKQKHQELSKNIVDMQSRVISLSDLVLVVDSNSEQQAEGGSESTLEDQLQGLSERWSVVCGWTEKRSKILASLQDHHQNWDKDSKRIGTWLKQIEGQLMSNEALGDDRDYALGAGGNDTLIQRYEQLQRLQLEMEEKLSEINTLAAEAQGVTAEFNDPYQTEFLLDKWGVVSEILTAQSHRMSKYKQNPVVKKTRDYGFMDVNILHQAVTQDEPKAKRLKTITWLNENKQNLTEWIERTRALISGTFDELSVEEQIVLYEDIENEFRSYAGVFEKYVQSVQDIDETPDPEIATKWKSIEQSLVDRKALIDDLVQEKQQQSRILDLQQILQTYSTWVESSTPTQANHMRLATELKIKNKTLSTHASKIKDLEDLVAGGNEKNAEEAKKVLEFYHSIVKKLEEKQVGIQAINNLSTQEAQDIEIKHAADLISKSKEMLDSKDKIASGDQRQHVSTLKVLVEEMKQMKCEDNPEFKETIVLLEQEIQDCEQAHEAFIKWKEKLESFEKWLDEVNVFIVAETPGVGDPEIIEAQLEQSNDLQKDIETLEAKYNEIINEGKNYSTREISIRARVLKLVGTWNETVRKAKEQNALLDDCAKKTNQVTKGYADLNLWLASVKDSINSESNGLRCDTSIELSRLTRKYRALNEQVDSKLGLFNQVNELSNDLLVTYNSTLATNAMMMLQPTEQPGPINLAKSVTQINSSWNTTTRAVKTNFEKLRDLTDLYGEFRSLTATMTDSLDRLEKKIHIDEVAAGDMEELSMQIDDLDNTIPAIQSRLAQIQNINSKLSDSGLNISDDIQHLEARFEGLHAKYLEKRSALDSQVAELSAIEFALMNISKQIDSIMQEYHDECGGSITSVKSQLEGQLKNLNQIKATISSTLNEETRTRLEMQRQQLESKLQRINAKVGSYDVSKLEKMWQSLRNIQCALAFLELGSVEIDDVSRQIACVEKEYASLSALKPQLEQILKEGRKKVGDDAKLTSQLDNIKSLYNQLGVQVSVIKNNLDQGLDIITKIHGGINLLKDYLKDIAEDNVRSSNQQELQQLLQRLPETKSELEVLNENIKAFSKLIDPILLQDLQDTNTMLQSEFTTKTQFLIKTYKDTYGKETVDVDAEFKTLEEELSKMKMRIDEMKMEYDVEGCFDVLQEINDVSEKIENLRGSVIHSVTLNADPFECNSDVSNKFNKMYDEFNVLSREVQSLETFEIHEDEADEDEPYPSEQVNRKEEVNPSHSSGFTGGIVNPCFDEDDMAEAEIDVTVPLKVPHVPPKPVVVEDEWNVAYKITKEADENEGDPEYDDDDDEEDLSRITVINTGKSGESSSEMKISSPGASIITSSIRLTAPSSTLPLITTTSKNVKIVEIRENEIVQGILRMEPIITETVADSKEYENYLRNLQSARNRLSEIKTKSEQVNLIPEPKDRISILDDLQENMESMILFISHGDSLSMKLSKEDLKNAKLVHDHNSKFKIEWSNLKSLIENSKMTCLWLETLLLECQILCSSDEPDPTLKSKVDQLVSHGVPFEIPVHMQIAEESQKAKVPSPALPQKQKKSPEQKKPAPTPILTEDEQELQKLESFINGVMSQNPGSLDEVKQIEISVSKMHRPTIKLLKNRKLPNECLAALDSKWKNLLEHVSRTRTEFENASSKPQFSSPTSSRKVTEKKSELVAEVKSAPAVKVTEAKVSVKDNDTEIVKETVKAVSSRDEQPAVYTKLTPERLSTVQSQIRALSESRAVPSSLLDKPKSATISTNTAKELTRVSPSQPPREQRAGSLPRWGRQDATEILMKWIDEASSALSVKLNITDENMLRNHISDLKAAEHQSVGKRLDAEKLDKSIDGVIKLQTQVRELVKKLPEERQLNEQKLSSLRKLKLQLDTTASWILEVRAQLATAKHRPENEKGLIIQGVLTRVNDREPEVHDVIKNYRNLQYEVESMGMSMDHYMKEKMRQLTEDWTYILQQQQLLPEIGSRRSSRSLTTSPTVGLTPVSVTSGGAESRESSVVGSPEGQSVSSEGDSRRSGTYPGLGGLSGRKDSKEDDQGKSGGVRGSGVVGDGGGSKVSHGGGSSSSLLVKPQPTVGQHVYNADTSPNSSKPGHLDLSSSAGVKIPASDSVFTPIKSNSSGDEQEAGEGSLVDAIKNKDSLPISDSQKKEILNLIEILETLDNNMTLNLKQLKQQIVLVGDPEHIQFVLEKQKNVRTELEMKRPQLDELLLTAENLKSQENRQQLYAKLTRLMDHWTETNQAVTGRLQVLEECLHDSINWSCQLEHIHATLDSHPPLKNEVISNNFSDFLSLTSNLIVKYCGEDTSKLSSTLVAAQLLRIEWKLNKLESGQPIEGSSLPDLDGELNSMTFDTNTTEETKTRWNILRNRVVAMRSKISNTIYNTPTSTLTQSLSGQPLQRNQEIELRELTEWVIRKEIQLPITNPNEDLPTLEVQYNSLQNFMQELECKRPIIESCLRQQRYQQQYNQNDDKAQGNGQREVDRLEETWNLLCNKAEQLHGHLHDIIGKQKHWSEELDDCSARLATAEAIKSRWATITAAADKSNILDQLKTFREHISSANKAIQDLNTHFKALDLKKEPQRLVDLNNRLTNLLQDSPVPLLVNAYISHPWEKLHVNGVPYYVNHSTETTQWDHPSMSQLLEQMTDYNTIRFSAYRTALKLRAIQKHIQLDRITLPTLVTTFENLGLRGTNDRLLDVHDMTLTLQTLHMNSEACAYLTDMTLNWILNVYDGSRTGSVRNLSFKIGLVLLSKGSMEDKFRYLFRLVADLNKTVDQRKLGLLLHDCMQIPRVLGEVAAFGGSNIEPSVRSCFEKCSEGENLKVNQFIEWTKQEPQSIVWLPVLHRVAASEGQSHNAKCNVCKTVPILGLRYRCLKCFNFDMCQKCFFSGRKSKSHKLSHPMQEYCIESTSSEDVRDFTRALKNKFKSKRKLEKTRKLGYLPVQSLLEGDTFESPLHSPQHSLSPELSHHRFVIDNNLPGPGPNGTAHRELPTEMMNNNRGSSQSSWLNNIHSTQTPESDDEHSLIAAYCQSLSKPSSVIPRSPIQVLSSIDADHSIQLESVIRSLEQENQSLQTEYNRLIQKKSSIGSPTQIINNIENNNILNEARLLRVHKGRLEARMQILEDHNRQLEQQLCRLRQLLDEPKSEASRTGTLQSKSVVASELDYDAPPNNLKSTNQYMDKNATPTQSPTSTFAGQPGQSLPPQEGQIKLPMYSRNLGSSQTPQSETSSAQAAAELFSRIGDLRNTPGNAGDSAEADD